MADLSADCYQRARGSGGTGDEGGSWSRKLLIISDRLDAGDSRDEDRSVPGYCDRLGLGAQ
jgi:hypothetical protein